MPDDQRSIRTRFAPSPSGHLHVGGARTALFCWAYAKGCGGKFILRIEDTDQKRSSDAASMAFLEDLKWLGIEWDEGPEFEGCGGGDAGPYHQSQRREIYQQHIDRLIAEGAAYRAFDTAEELDAARAEAQKEKQNYRYDRAALELDDATVQLYLAEGRPFVVRLKVDESRTVSFHDEVIGEVTVPPDELDDFVIMKADGFPTYHFAVVVDDELMGVTHVIRAQEHLKNTAKHVLIQEALGFAQPVYAHVSVISNPDGSKMSKRDKAKAARTVAREHWPKNDPVLHWRIAARISRDGDEWFHNQQRVGEFLQCKHDSLDIAEAIAAYLEVRLPEIEVQDFRRSGYLPDALVNYLALLGWNPGGDVEHFDRQFLIENFNLDRLQKSAAKFDREKLLAFNLKHVQDLPPEEFAQQFRAWADRFEPDFVAAFIERYGSDAIDELARINQSRSKTLRDPIESCRFFLLDDDEIEVEDTKPVRKALGGDPGGLDLLAGVLDPLRKLSSHDWTAATLEETISAYAEQRGVGLGKLAQPLRIAVTGGVVSPGIYETLAILGRDSTLRRIERLLERNHRGTESTEVAQR